MKKSLLLFAVISACASAYAQNNPAGPKDPGKGVTILDTPDEAVAESGVSGGAKKSGRDESIKMEDQIPVSKFFRHRLFGFSANHSLSFLGSDPKQFGHASGMGGGFGLGIIADLELKNYSVSSIGDKSIKRWKQLGLQVAAEYSGGVTTNGGLQEDVDRFNFSGIVKYYFPMAEMGFGSIPVVKYLTPWGGMGPGITMTSRDVITVQKTGLTYAGPTETDFIWHVGGGALFNYFKTFIISYSITFGVNLSGGNVNFKDEDLPNSNVGVLVNRVAVLYPF